MRDKFVTVLLLLGLLLITINFVTASRTHASYNAGLGVNLGTRGSDITVGITLHNVINSKYLFNLYGSWDYRFWGYQSWKNTGSVGIGFGAIKSLVNLKKPVYFDKAKKKYFKSLGIGASVDLEQKFSKVDYIGGRYGATVWGQLNRNMLGLSVGIDHTRSLPVGTYGKVHYSFLFGE